jgi:hypothetical protein
MRDGGAGARDAITGAKLEQLFAVTQDTPTGEHEEGFIVAQVVVKGARRLPLLQSHAVDAEATAALPHRRGEALIRRSIVPHDLLLLRQFVDVADHRRAPFPNPHAASVP